MKLVLDLPSAASGWDKHTHELPASIKPLDSVPKLPGMIFVKYTNRVPLQSISYQFGSKFMSGYFVQQGGKCIVTLMVVEKSDPEEPLSLSPTRVRLLLDPDQIAGLDSEEGQSVNLTCTDGGKVLVVDVGERDRLVELQDHALQKAIALSQ